MIRRRLLVLVALSCFLGGGAKSFADDSSESQAARRKVSLRSGVLLPAADAAPGKLLYNRDIRPILSDNCFACHGNDKHKIKGKLKLNDRESALERKAIIPGKPDESELVSRIFSKDPDEQMPPPESQKKLTDAQKEILKRWVAEGAEYQPHWAYVPLVKTEPPKVKNAAWVRNPIDAFVLAVLEAKGIAPSPEADRRTLLRRLSLDLIGLPPRPAEVDAFVNDKSPDAYEKQVDRLLASPHFGERMAVPWLDAVRYADTVGYHGDQNQHVFPYRDYVINAFNTNKPFDQFTIEQLAGDLLLKPTQEQLIASGYNRLGMVTREGGAQPKEYIAKYQADRVRTTSLAWLGSTFGCAECHDHKFDPISTKDFYSMSAFFADIRQWGVYSDYTYTPNPDLKGWTNDHPFPPEILVDSPYLAARKAKLEDQVHEQFGFKSTLLLSDAKARAHFKEWIASTAAFLKASPTGWHSPEILTAAAQPNARPPQNKPAKPAAIQPEEKQGDKAKANADEAAASDIAKPAAKAKPALPPGFVALLGQAKGKTVAPTEISLRPEAGWIASIRLEAAAESAAPAMSAAAQRQGIRLSVSIKPGKGVARKVAIYHADAEHKEPRYAGSDELIGVRDGWKIPAAFRKTTQSSYWLLDPPQKLDAGDTLLLSISGDPATSVRVSTSPLAAIDVFRIADAKAINSIVDIADGKDAALSNGNTAYSTYLISTAVDAPLFDRYKDLHRQILECRDGQAMMQIPVSQKPIVTRILPRGNWQDETAPIVTPTTPHFLPPLPGTEGKELNRLDLAKWIVSEQNPLTRRVIVNRLWKQFFGLGLCASVEDVGLQGEWPSHPELLDYLAYEFREPSQPGAKPWDVKRIVRMMVTSNTYRQASGLRPELRDVDPQNRMLSCQSPRRLEAEFVRDNALFAAGLLNINDIGGPSVKPYQPEGYYAALQFPDRKYVADADDREYRRGLYMHWQRTFLHPMLANFDAPSREDSVCTRNVSNTPQQALTLLNDPEFVEASRVLAEKLVAAGGDDATKLEQLYQRVVCRSPKAAEKQSLLEFLTEQRKTYKASPEDAQKLLAVGNSPASDENPAELAAWTNTCRVVLNLHETVTRY